MICNSIPVLAQNAKVHGVVRDINGKGLELVNIVAEDGITGTTTDEKGYYEINIIAKKKTFFTVSYMGYHDTTISIKLTENERKKIDVQLKPKTTIISGVTIEDEKARTTTFNRIDPKTLTVIAGPSEDVSALIKTLPGVASSNELTSQYSVRGGNFDENIIYVNGIEIHRPFLTRSGQHEGLSFINSDLISTLSFSAGGFEARYGDKMSSVLDITYKKPLCFHASATLSFLTQSIHVEDKVNNFSYLVGIRQKNNRYLLGSLDEKGSYKPSFTDIQTLLNYEINNKLELSLLGNFSRNIYRFSPDSMDVAYGDITTSYKLYMYMEGYESDKFNNGSAALTLSYKPNTNTKLSLIGSYFKSIEKEKYDIWNEYWISRLDMNLGSENYGKPIDALGVGTYMNHARNIYNSDIFSIALKGVSNKNKHFIQWGVEYKNSNIYDKLNEYMMLDSAGFTLPTVLDSLGYTNPDAQDDFILNMYKYVNTENTLNTYKLSAFIQDSWTIERNEANIYLNYGIRSSYQNVNNSFALSPRLTISLKPKIEKDMLFRFSTGYYVQPPVYRELRDMKGTLHRNIKSQQSLHLVAGMDWNLQMLGRQFKFVSELYYKHLKHLIPYTINNVMIKYYPEYSSTGFATGADFKLSGELTPGVDSWISLSLMKTMERLADTKFIPRPTDQLINFSIFLQDYIPYNPRFTVSLNLIFGTGLPVMPFERSIDNKPAFRYPAYRRVDIGFGWQIVNHKILSKYSYLNRFQIISLNLEVLNLLQIKNTISYNFITDITGMVHFIPTFLSGRMLNLKLIIKY